MKEGLGLTFELTAPNTPQRNGRIERKFATLYGRVRSMLNGARITQEMREGLWAEACNTATKLEVALVYEANGNSSHSKFWKEEPKHARHLRTFGEMGVIKLQQDIKGKLRNRGKTVMFVGYSEDSSPDTYRFYDPSTRKINGSRDVYWLNKSYGDWKRIKKTNVRKMKSSILVEEDDDNIGDNNETGKTTMNATKTGMSNKTTGRELRNLEWAMDPPNANLRSTRSQTRLANAQSESRKEEANRIMERQEEVVDFESEDESDNEESAPLFPDVANVVSRDIKWPDMAMHAMEVMLEAVEDPNVEEQIQYVEPKNFREAWDHPDEEQRDKWREAIRKEFKDMI